jgi:hypothetical protein
VRLCPILAASGVTLVIEPPAESAEYDKIDGAALRVLGLFSLPDDTTPLSLRRERYSLVKLIESIAADGRAVEPEVLQYGVTREQLAQTLQRGGGWDIIHISGHGSPGELMLERPDGTSDPVRADELIELLGPARERVKLVTVSSCWSAAPTEAELSRLLGLPVTARHQGRTRVSDGGRASGALATDLAQRLGCAVLAMRYSVSDDFAM